MQARHLGPAALLQHVGARPGSVLRSAASCVAASGAVTKRFTQTVAARSVRALSAARAVICAASPEVTQPPQKNPSASVAATQATHDQNHSVFDGR